jgi:hypothetical protein
MGTTLTGTKPKDTYDSLIKVGDNGPIGATAKTLSDGLGNDLPISVSTSNVGIGTSSPTSKLQVSGGDVRILNVGTQLVLGSGIAGLYEIGVSTGDRLDISKSGTSTYLSILPTGGITFNGDTAAANALDDYEEGTWTMGVSFGNAAAGITTSSNTGTYTKVGRQVTVNGYLVLTSKGSSTGVAKITGLPFTIANSNANTSVPSLWFNVITFVNQFQGYGEIGLTTIRLQESTSLGVASDLTDVDFANNSAIIVSFTYFV